METKKTEMERMALATDTVRAALEFARESAQNEIESIDRLHKRTLTALSFPLLTFALLFSFLGWLGYVNLKRIAVQTTTNVVRQRLDDELTKKNIDDAVRQVLREHAAGSISKAVHAQVLAAVAQEMAKQAPELRALSRSETTRAVASIEPQIEAFARQQALDLILKANEPRHLDVSKRRILIGCAQSTGRVTINVGVGGEHEAQLYEEQISNALEAGGWRIEKQTLLASRLDFPEYGLVVATTPQLQHSATLTALTGCLRSASLGFQLVISSKPAEWGDQTTLVVLPKIQ